MTNPLAKPCTGFRCDWKDRCEHYYKAGDPFSYMSPLATEDECHCYKEKQPKWGEGGDQND